MNLTISITPTTTPTTIPGTAILATTSVAASPIVSVPTIVDDDDFDMSELATDYARCSDGNGTLSHLFFSDDDYEIARAKAICVGCGLKEQCLRGALERGEPYGVWGGKLVLEGVAVEFKRGRGRPRKNPQPVLVVDEAPLPPHLVA